MKEKDEANKEEKKEENPVDSHSNEKQENHEAHKDDKEEPLSGGSSEPPMGGDSPGDKGTTPTPPPDKPSFFSKLLKAMNSNKPASAFAIALLVVIVWSLVVHQSNKVQHQREVSKMVAEHSQAVDSLNIRNLELSARVFSWSVRSELMRKNTENLNQLFTVFVQESDANLVQLISVEDGTVTISTDKQFEGRPLDIKNLTELLAQRIVTDDNGTTVYLQVMGFNEPIGILMARKSN